MDAESIGRCGKDGNRLEALPFWRIKFDIETVGQNLQQSLANCMQLAERKPTWMLKAVYYFCHKL